MGQAKRRGTFEERKAAAIRRNKESAKKHAGIMRDEILYRKFDIPAYQDIIEAANAYRKFSKYVSTGGRR